MKEAELLKEVWDGLMRLKDRIHAAGNHMKAYWIMACSSILEEVGDKRGQRRYVELFGELTEPERLLREFESLRREAESLPDPLRQYVKAWVIIDEITVMKGSLNLVKERVGEYLEELEGVEQLPEEPPEWSDDLARFIRVGELEKLKKRLAEITTTLRAEARSLRGQLLASLSRP